MGSGALVYASLNLDLPAPLRPEPQCVLVAVSGTPYRGPFNPQSH